MYRCVELTSGKESSLIFHSLANAIHDAHCLNKLEPKERWVVVPLIPWGTVYSKIAFNLQTRGRE